MVYVAHQSARDLHLVVALECSCSPMQTWEVVVLAQAVGVLWPTWETWMKLLASASGLDIAGVGGVKQYM